MSDPTVRITWVGGGLNVALCVIKMGIGAMVGSISLIADGVHSLSDLLTDVAVLIGVKVAQRPADASHPYGHGKYETFASAFVAIVLVGAGLAIMWKSAGSLLADHHAQFPYCVIAVAALSIVVKEWLFRATRLAARAVASPAAMANAWHHRSDALSSVAVLAGAILGVTGWPHWDQVAGVVVGTMVVAAGGKLFFDAGMELSEASVGQRGEEAFRRILADYPEARGWHKYRGRRVGRELFMDCHVQVDPDTSVRASHALTQRIEERLRAELDRPLNLLIHIEPHLPQTMRPDPAAPERPFEQNC